MYSSSDFSNIALPGVAQWRTELTTTLAPSEVDDTDVLARYAM